MQLVCNIICYIPVAYLSIFKQFTQLIVHLGEFLICEETGDILLFLPMHPLLNCSNTPGLSH